jgi:hypothetical protein
MKAWLIAVIVVCFALLPATSELDSQTVTGSLAVSPASLDFGELAVGSQSRPITVTISNPGTATVALQDVLLSGIDFSETTDCGHSLVPGASCTLQASFKPVIPGQRVGNLAITGSDSGSPHFVAVVGTGK